MIEAQSGIKIAVVLAFVALPALITLLGVASLNKIARFQRRTARVTGTVTNIRLIRRQDGKPDESLRYQTEFSYPGPTGEILHGLSAIQTQMPKFSRGDTVPLRIDPANPDRVYEGDGPSKTRALAMVLIGGCIAVAGMLAIGPVQ